MNASQDFLKTAPKNLYGWLTQTGPLTSSLKQAFPDWKMQVLSQAWQENLRIWLREIVHIGSGKKLIYARLEVPEQTYKKYQSELENLGKKPIGVTLLYANPDVSRSDFSYSRMPCSLLGEGLYWARQSTFYWKHLPLSLTEVFAPDLPEPGL